jgi:hypothetical protein
VPDQHHRLAAKAREPALDRPVVAERPVAGERRVLGEQGGDVAGEVRPLRMACDLGLLPGGELGVGLTQELLGARLEARDLVLEVEVAAVGEVTQLLDLAFQLADRLLELEQFFFLP